MDQGGDQAEADAGPPDRGVAAQPVERPAAEPEAEEGAELVAEGEPALGPKLPALDQMIAEDAAVA